LVINCFAVIHYGTYTATPLIIFVLLFSDSANRV
jgi:hypothetical protein